MENKKISVVVPCYNEGRSIYANIKKIDEYLSRLFLDWEIIAINDGSLDETREELLRAKEDNHRLIFIDKKENQGKGRAVKDGISASSGEIVAFLDADLAIPIEEMGKFVKEVEKGNDLVIASRFIPGLRLIEPVLWYRRIMEKIFRLLRILIIGMREIQDTQCGFKVFSQKAARLIFPKLTVDRFAFDAEIIFIAKKNKFKILEMPVALQNPKASSVRIYRDSANMLGDLFRVRINSFRKLYDSEFPEEIEK